jgi:hypothetical protein
MDEREQKPQLHLPLIVASTAAEICEKSSLSDTAIELLGEEMTPEGFLEALIEAELFPDAIKFLAQALPKKEAVIWARDCSREESGAAHSELDEICLEAVDRWLAEPSDENRRTAMDLADKAGYKSSASMTAAAAAWTEGGMGPAEYDDVLPPETLAGTMSSSAVLMAALESRSDKTAETQHRLLESGLVIAQGAESND